MPKVQLAKKETAKYVTQNENLSLVDLFCGCGGMSLGFQNAGFNILAAFDNWKPAIETYNNNFDHRAELLDLGDIQSTNRVSRMRPDVIVGGPPCQDFSSAGYKNFSEARANLVDNFATLVCEIAPSYFVMENVPRMRNSKIFIDAKEKLINRGYGITQIIINASQCGVPQQRKRLFLIGSIDSEDGFLEEEISQRLSEKKLTIREYFGNKLDINHYFRVPTNYNRRGIFSVDEPSVTVRGIDRPIPKGYKGHPLDPVNIKSVRGLTVKERSLIQTFPDDFIFPSGKTNANQLIGNAVPVTMAELIALALSEYASKEK